MKEKLIFILGAASLLFQPAHSISNSILSATLSPQSNIVSAAAPITFAISLSIALPLFSDGDCIKFTVTNPYTTISTDPSLIAIQNDYKAFPAAPSGVTCDSLTTDVLLSCSSNTDFVLTMMVGIPTSGPTIKSLSGKISSFQNPFSTVNTVVKIGYYDQCLGSPTTITAPLSFVSGSFIIEPIPDVTLTSSSTVIGTKDNMLTVSFKPNTIVQVKGTIELTVPPYYTLSSGASLESMISNDPNNPPLVTSADMTVSNVAFRPTDRTLQFTYDMSSKADNTKTLTFTVSKFNNPINKEPLSGFKLLTADPNGNTIDQTVGSFILSQTATEATIQTAAIEIQRVVDSLIDSSIGQKNRKIQISFQIDFPIEESCYIKISFPEDIKIDADETLESFSGEGFVANSILQSQVIKRAFIYGADLSTCDCNYVLIPGCTDTAFLGASGQAIIHMERVVSPAQVKDTDNFHIDLYKDQAMNSRIATTRTNGLLNLKFNSGSWSTGAISGFYFRTITDNTIQASTDFAMSFKVTNNLYQDSVIDIQLPPKCSSLSTTSCSILSTSSQFDSGVSCSILSTVPNTVLRISQPFLQSRPELWAMVVDSSSAEFMLQINGIKNPLSVASAGQWSVTTKNKVGTIYYPVDQGSSTNGSYTPDKGSLTAASTGGVIPTSSTTNIITSYRFKIALGHDVPASGKIKIDLPSDFQIPSGVSCVAPFSCTAASNSVTVTVSALQSASSILDFSVSGIQNPRTFKPTDNTNIRTYDASMNLIDEGTGFSTQMTTMNTFPSFSATMLNKTNGAATEYTITFVSNIVPILAGDIMYITFPTNVLLPTNVQCTPLTRLTNIQCSNSGQNMILKIVSLSGPTGTFLFKVKNVLNPSSTKVSQEFKSIYMTDSQGYNIMQLLSSVKPTVQTTTPANILTYSLYQDNLAMQASATYRLEFTPTNQISPTGSILITWPSQIVLPSDVTCFVTTNQKYGDKCTINQSSRTITILNAFSGMTSGYQGSIQIELSPITNPKDNREVDGFTIATFDDAAMTQKIDVLGGGLMVPKTECNYPCRSCLGGLPDYCLQCWTDDDLKFLQMTSDTSTCQQQCNQGYSTNGDTNKICMPCDATCKTCLNNGAVGDKFRCVTCADATKYQYVDSKKCASKCEAGFYESAKYKCSTCKAPCYKCEGTSTTCTDCFQDSKYPLLYNKTCVEQCPVGFAGVSQVCLQCQKPCQTCVNSTTTCLSCDQKSEQKYFFAYQCFKECPLATVPDEKAMVCRGCATGCKLCDKNNQTKCYECMNPLILFGDTCLTDCPLGYVVNGDGTGCELVVLKDLSLIYFPHLSCCLLMTILAVGGWFKDRRSLILSNIIVLCSPLEIFSFLVQLGLSVFFSTIYGVAATAFAFLIYVALNITFAVMFEKKIRAFDEDYQFWRSVHPTTARFVVAVSGLLSFKMIRLKYSYLYGFDSFKARFTQPEEFRKLLIRFTWAHVILSNCVIVAIDVFNLLSFSIDSQIKINMIETAVISIVMAVLQLCELRKARLYMKTGYGMVEQDSLAQVYSEEGNDKQIRRDMLKKIMQQFKGNQELINDAEINHKLEQLIHKFRPRRCNSMGPSDALPEEDPRLVHSEPPTPKPDWQQDEVNGLAALDNVYADSKPSDPLGKVGKTFTDATSQVHPDELGRVITRKGVEFMYAEGYEQSRIRKRDKHKKRGRKNQYYTQIDAEDDEEAGQAKQEVGRELEAAIEEKLGIIDEEEVEEEKARKNSKKLNSKSPKKSSPPKAEEKPTDIFNQTFKPTSDEPMVQVPPDAGKRNFNECDILGDFDTDEKGHLIILQDGSGNLIDKQGRRVNERGYLIDPLTGDVIEHLERQPMFLNADLDDRGEIPAPFCVEKHNFNPFKLMGDFDKSKRKGNDKDRWGRRVTKQGWLIDSFGNITDYMGIKKIDRRHLTPEGEIPKLFNYGGKRFDILDVCGSFEIEAQTGSIKLKRNAQGQCFDNQGRLVNERGYLIDYKGNVVDREGRLIFEKRHLSQNGEFPKIFPFTKFNIKNIQGDFEMDPLGNPILERNAQGHFTDRQGQRVNQRGYFCDDHGNIVDKKGKVMFAREILDQDGDIPEVFRTGLLRSDTGSSLSRLMSEIERNQPEEMYNNQTKQRKKVVVINKNTGGGNTSVESGMEDTPSNYNIPNQRFHGSKKNVRIDDNVSQEGVNGTKRKKHKRRKKVVQEYSEPSEKDIQMAKAYGGVARGTLIKPKRGIHSPSSQISRQSKKLNNVAGSVAGFMKNKHSNRELEEVKRRDLSDRRIQNNQSALVLNDTNDPSMMAVPEHHLREQKLKQQKLKELKMKGKARKNAAGDPDFEKMFGKDIDEFLEDSDWDIESFENVSNFSRGTARSAFLDGRIRGLESIYLQRIESSMKRGGGLKAKKNSMKPKFRVMQDLFIDDPAILQDVEGLSSHNSQQQKPRKLQYPQSNSAMGQSQPMNPQGRNKPITSQTQYREAEFPKSMY